MTEKVPWGFVLFSAKCNFYFTYNKEHMQIYLKRDVYVWIVIWLVGKSFYLLPWYPKFDNCLMSFVYYLLEFKSYLKIDALFVF